VRAEAIAGRGRTAGVSFGMVVLVAGLVGVGPTGEQPKGSLSDRVAAAQLTPTPTLAACRPTPTPIPVTVIPGVYAIFPLPGVGDRSMLAMDLAQLYGLTSIEGADPDAPFFTATVPADRVSALRADARLFSVDEIVAVPAPFEFVQAPCVTATPTATPAVP
jgi:hypothetical protein